MLIPALVAPSPLEAIRAEFRSPPASARPWVYWYFMEGAMTRKGMTADLEAMRKAGIGGAIFLEVNIGIPVGLVRYMSPEWRKMVGYAVHEADRLGIEIALGTGPGWCGTGGPWVEPEGAMQHLVSSETTVVGPIAYRGTLPQPRPRTPFFGEGTLTPELRKKWESYYRDEAVVAMPADEGKTGLSDLDEKSLVYRAPFSSAPSVKAFLTPESRVEKGASRIIDLTGRIGKDGTLDWAVPPGRWTILRFGRTLTGSTTRPAPDAGLGFETDKFETAGIDAHLGTFIDAIVKETGPNVHPGRGLTTLHFDSWEMGSQNWSAHFRAEFQKRRGYDPLRYLPVMAGRIVDSVDVSERFLWDLRQTAQELVIANHLGAIRAKAKGYGLGLDVEPYDMNPTSDLALGATANVPMGEFWSKGYGFDSEYSVNEAVSVGHTNGRPIVAAESFTADDRDGWLQHPASMKAQGDWALATGINRFAFHRYQHQPDPNAFPGMTMGPYGVHWERTQTWWDMVPAYHTYLSRSQNLLRKGLSVADILYLVPEGAPNVFQPPADATVGRLPDRRGYNFDGCAPGTLIARASAKNGRIVFPDGMSYRALVLPRVETMTPELLRKVKSLVDGGVTVVGKLPRRSPSLVAYPACDWEVATLAATLKGKVVPDDGSDVAPLGLEGARWIWTAEGSPLVAAPAGVRTFRRTLTLPKGRSVASARVAATADNSFRLTVNGKAVAEGFDFHRVQEAEVAPLLNEGDNALTLVVENEGTAPNPAGAILKLEIRFKDGGQTTLVTDGSWSGAKELGDWTVAPWSLTASSLPPGQLYPSYASTARLLARSLSPDLEAGEGLRYGHRRIGALDAYFVANRRETPFVGDATFRALGQPEWWDPLTGETRPLARFTRHGGTTTVPLRLPASGSGFVVFRPATAQKVVGRENFPQATPFATVNGPWTVAFDPKFGGPASAAFARLDDWRSHPDPGIRLYSGKATYRTTFDGAAARAITLGEVRNMASVRVNGKELGVAWCAPWQVPVPVGLLRPKGNRLEITVANLWANRLIGDAGLPPERRITRTTWSPYRADSPLLPSGLLGPVRLLR